MAAPNSDTEVSVFSRGKGQPKGHSAGRRLGTGNPPWTSARPSNLALKPPCPCQTLLRLVMTASLNRGQAANLIVADRDLGSHSPSDPRALVNELVSLPASWELGRLAGGGG